MAEESLFGREVLWDEDGETGWVHRVAVPDPDEALLIVAQEVYGGEGAEIALEEFEVTEALMREETEVEAKINGHEFGYWTHCTTRAKGHEAFWQVDPA